MNKLDYLALARNGGCYGLALAIGAAVPVTLNMREAVAAPCFPSFMLCPPVDRAPPPAIAPFPATFSVTGIGAGYGVATISAINFITGQEYSGQIGQDVARIGSQAK